MLKRLLRFVLILSAAIFLLVGIFATINPVAAQRANTPIPIQPRITIQIVPRVTIVSSQSASSNNSGQSLSSSSTNPNPGEQNPPLAPPVPSATPTSTNSVTPTSTPTATSTPTSTPTATETPTVSPTATSTLVPTATATPTHFVSPAELPTATATTVISPAGPLTSGTPIPCIPPTVRVLLGVIMAAPGLIALARSRLPGLRTLSKRNDPQCGAPANDPGFKITRRDDQLLMGKGKYLAGGMTCENSADVGYAEQPGFVGAFSLRAALAQFETTVALVYLDAWQRHVETSSGDETRMENFWQVRLLPIKTRDARQIKPSTQLAEWDALNEQHTNAPDGTRHHFCRLAILRLEAGGAVTTQDCRIILSMRRHAVTAAKWGGKKATQYALTNVAQAGAQRILQDEAASRIGCVSALVRLLLTGLALGGGLVAGSGIVGSLLGLSCL
jgi:hypothetical protein